MGAYEFQGGDAPPPAGPVCDVDVDGQVDVHDLLGFIHSWVGGEAAADMNGDGVVDVGDLLEFLDCFLMR